MPVLRLPACIPHKPSTKQIAFLLFNGLEAFYGGAAGGGKTDALLMAALQYVDYPEYAALLLRRSYTDLALPGALMDRAHEWLGKGGKTAKAHWDRETHTYTFPSGATLSFGYISTSSDRFRYQSAEFQFIGWDEVTEFPDEEDYTFLMSRLRRLSGSDIPLRVRSASNPVGKGTFWVKKRFVDGANEDRIFVPATFEDNAHIDRESYRKALSNLHPRLQEALIEGSWDIAADSAFPEFDAEIHVVPPFRLPQDWRIWEAMDFGITNPTAWFSAALTEDGDTIVQGEYYSPGLIVTHASRILTLRENYWGHPSIALCDPSIQARTGFGESGKGETVHSQFGKNGIYLVPANNDRRAGRDRISELLRPDPDRVFPNWHIRAGELGAPRLYFSSTCKNVIEQLAFAPLDEDDLDTVDAFWESRYGHAIAALRYLVTARIYPRERPFEYIGGDRELKSKKWGEWNAWTEG